MDKNVKWNTFASNTVHILLRKALYEPPLATIIIMLYTLLKFLGAVHSVLALTGRALSDHTGEVHS